MTRRLLLVLTLAPLAAGPAHAGILFNRKPARPTPAERVPQLIQTLKTDGDEKKRAGAAEELRQYDPTQFPDMIPALIDALMNDKKPGVRAEAAQTLGKLRPVSQQVGQALLLARDKDESMRVRLQARSSLLDYRWHGFKQDGKPADLPGATKEPPLADKPPTQELRPMPVVPTPPVTVKPPEKPVEPRVVAPPQPPQPQPQEPRPMPAVTPQPMGPQRMPNGPALPQPDAEPPHSEPTRPVEGPALPVPGR
jgi:hypothetical protein